MKTSNSLAFKFDAPAQRVRRLFDQNSRVGSTPMQNARWFSFELFSGTDLHDALNWLGLAYAAAGKRKKLN
jgi:hypothetical protein